MKIRMKRFVNISVLSLVWIFAEAQIPVIDISWFPEDGDQYELQRAYSVSVAAGNGGADQTWNFSSLVDSSNSKVTSYITASSTPHSALFPSSNLAAVEAGDAYDYFKVGSTDVQYGGSFTPNYSLILNNHSLRYEMPFTYQDQFLDSLEGTLYFGNFDLEYTGTSNFEVDGYGTLLLPDGRQFDSVLRYVWTEQTVAAHPVSGPLFESTTQNFVWVSPECPQPLLSINYFHQLSGDEEFTSKSVLYSKGVFTSTFNQQSEHKRIEIIPNPTDGGIRLLHDLRGDIQLSLLDLSGKLVYEMSFFGNEQELDVSHLLPGIYVIHVSSGDNTGVEKLVIY